MAEVETDNRTHRHPVGDGSNEEGEEGGRLGVRAKVADPPIGPRAEGALAPGRVPTSTLLITDQAALIMVALKMGMVIMEMRRWCASTSFNEMVRVVGRHTHDLPHFVRLTLCVIPS